MMKRAWFIKINGTANYYCEAYITLNKLKHTIRKLKLKGDKFNKNRWATPIVPLLIEHIFMSIKTFNTVESITLRIVKGKDINI